MSGVGLTDDAGRIGAAGDGQSVGPVRPAVPLDPCRGGGDRLRNWRRGRAGPYLGWLHDCRTGRLSHRLGLRRAEPRAVCRFRQAALGDAALYRPDVCAGKAPRVLGHNPAGGVMVLALLGLIALIRRPATCSRPTLIGARRASRRSTRRAPTRCWRWCLRMSRALSGPASSMARTCSRAMIIGRKRR